MSAFWIYLRYLIYFLELLALCIGLLAWKRPGPAAIRSIILLMAFTVLVEGYSEIRLTIRHVPPHMIVYYAYSLIEMLCWFTFFYRIFPSPIRRKIIIFLGISYLAFAVWELGTYHTWLHQFHTDAYRLYIVYIIGLAVLYLWDVMQHKDFHPLQKDPVFWLCSGILLFQSVFFVDLTVLNIPSFREDGSSVIIWNTLLYVSEIFYYSLLCVAFYISRRFSSSQQPFSNP